MAKMKPRLKKMRQHGTIMIPHLEILQKALSNLKRSIIPKKLLEPTRIGLLSQIANQENLGNPESLGRRKNLSLVVEVGVVVARTLRWNIDQKHRLLKLLLRVGILTLERMRKILTSTSMTIKLKTLSPLTRQVRLTLRFLTLKLHMPKKRRRATLTSTLPTTLRRR